MKFLLKLFRIKPTSTTIHWRKEGKKWIRIQKNEMEKDFLKECKQVRNDFVRIAGQYSVKENLELRTEIDTLLIMYDQLCERINLTK